MACCSLLALASCKEQEVETFSGERGINFIVPNSDASKEDLYENLYSTCDFYDYYVTKGKIDLDYVDVKVALKLEGPLSDQPLKIRLKAEPVEGAEMADLEMPGDSVLGPGEYKRTMTIRVKRPAEYDKEYQAVIKVDYDNSDFVAGTMERQQYKLTVRDEANMQDMEAESIDDWNQKFSATLGNYGPVKIRFIRAALGAQGYTSTSISYKYYYTLYYPTYGFNANLMTTLRDALKEYNDTHDKPLSEADGTPVTFPEPAE